MRNALPSSSNFYPGAPVGLGHVAFIDQAGEGGTWVVGGDVLGDGGYGVRRTWVPEGGTTEEPLIGWVEVRR